MTDFGRRAAVAAANVLPKTGQTTSYRTGDDGYYEAGWEGDRFTDNGDGTITDNATSLMWPDDLNTDGGNNGASLKWNGCLDYAEALDWKGYTDWRLPNIDEFISLVDFEQPSPKPYAIFQNIQALPFWTSTTLIVMGVWAYRWVPGAAMFQFSDKNGASYLFCCRDV